MQQNTGRPKGRPVFRACYHFSRAVLSPLSEVHLWIRPHTRRRAPRATRGVGRV